MIRPTKYARIMGRLRVFMLAIVGLFTFLQFNTIPSSTAPLSGVATSIKMEAVEGGSLEEVTLFSRESATSDKKITRKAHLVRYKNAGATVIMSHGFMCCKEDVAFLRRLFPRGKYNVMTFDYRAHGEDRDGQFCTFGRDEVYDLEAAAHYVRNHPDLKGLPCFVYGFSMGAATAIETQAKNAALFDAMILDCPFDSSENIIKRGLEGLKVSAFGYEFGMPGRSLLQKYAFHPHVQAFVKNVLRCFTSLDPRHIQINLCKVYPSESIKKVSCPCLFIHCKNDERISIDAVRNVYNNAASSYKKLWLTEGRHHYDSYFYAPERYTTEVRNFLTHVLDGTARKEEKKEIVEE